MIVWCVAAFANPYLPSKDEAPTARFESDPFVWTVPKEASAGVLQLRLRVPDGTAVYRDQITIEVLSGRAGTPVFPEPKLKPDPYEEGAWRTLYDTDVLIDLPVQAGTVELRIGHQGCRKGLCWPPTLLERTVVVK